VAEVLVTEKIKYRQFALPLHLTPIDLYCCLTSSMWIASKQTLVLKRTIGKTKKHGTRDTKVRFSNLIGVLFICCPLTLFISCNFDIRVYLYVHWFWFTAFT
jgi:hypothetical protein